MSIMSWATAVAAAAIVCDWPTLTDKQRKQEREREAGNTPQTDDDCDYSCDSAQLGG